jgi:hypothetical protein
MRRARLISFLLAGLLTGLVLVLPAGLNAQRSGGGHSMGGAMGGGGHAGGFHGGGPTPSSGSRSFAPGRPGPRATNRGAFRTGFARSGVRPTSRTSVFGARNAPFAARSLGPSRFAYFRPWFRPRLWSNWGYPGYYGGSGYPWSSLSYPGFPEDYQSGESYQSGPEEQGDAGPGYDDTLANQVRELTDEVASLRQEQGPPSGPAQYQPPAREESIPTVFAYRDGHQLEAQNYAIQGQTLWVFGDQITRKISLADLDLSATKQLNDKRGVEFNVPQ